MYRKSRRHVDKSLDKMTSGGGNTQPHNDMSFWIEYVSINRTKKGYVAINRTSC